jgi:hypothetical protein
VSFSIDNTADQAAHKADRAKNFEHDVTSLRRTAPRARLTPGQAARPSMRRYRLQAKGAAAQCVSRDGYEWLREALFDSGVAIRGRIKRRESAFDLIAALTPTGIARVRSMVRRLQPVPRRSVPRQVRERLAGLAVDEGRMVLAVRDHLTGIAVGVLRRVRVSDGTAGRPEGRNRRDNR